jgi:hypothetical protein
LTALAGASAADFLGKITDYGSARFLLSEAKPMLPTHQAPSLSGGRSSSLGIEPEALRTVEEAVAFAGPFTQPATAAIIVGARNLSLVKALHAVLPSVESVLVIEPDRAARRRAEQAIDARAPGLRGPDTYVFAHEEPSPDGYSVEAYVIAARYLMAMGAPTGDVPMLVDEPSLERNPDLYIPILAALIDLDWEQSRTFLSLLPSVEALPADLGLRWPHYLAQNGSPYHALKFLYAVRPLLAERNWARRAAHCFTLLRASGSLLNLIPLVANTPDERRSMEREVVGAMELTQADNAARLRANLAALRIRRPGVVEQIRAVSSTSHQLAMLPPIPWWLTGLPALPVLRERYPLFFRADAEGLEELNSPTCPKPLHDALMAHADVVASPVLVGAMERVDTLLNLAEVRKGPLYAVEERIDVARTLLEAFDWVPLMRDPRNRMLFGPGGSLELLRDLAENPEIPLPEVRVGMLPAFEEVMTELAAERARLPE